MGEPLIDMVHPVGTLDRCISEMLVVAGNIDDYDEPDRQTLKHHAEDPMKQPHLIRQQWEAYVAQVYPSGAPDAQLREVRRGFFAGATALLGTMHQILSDTGDPSDVTDFDLSVMDAINVELHEFAARVAAQPD